MRTVVAAPVAVLDVGARGQDVVGIHITGDVLREAIDQLPHPATFEERPVLVLRIESDGGFLAEVPPLAELIANELPDDGWRVVVWVERALSAAALVAISSQEIVLQDDGVLGAAVATDRAGGVELPLEGAELEAALRVGTRCAELGGHDPAVVISMQERVPLYMLTSGALTNTLRNEAAETINPPGEVLTLNAVRAQEVGLALGRASTSDGLVGVLGVSDPVQIDAVRAQEILDAHAQEVTKQIVAYRDHITELDTLLALGAMVGLDQPVLDDLRARGEIRLALLRALLEARPRLGVHAGCEESCLLVYESKLEGLGSSP